MLSNPAHWVGEAKDLSAILLLLSSSVFGFLIALSSLLYFTHLAIM